MRILLLIISFFLFSCQNNKVQKLTVGIQPYVDFPKDKTDTIAKTIADFYQIQTVVLPIKSPYKEAFVTIKSPRYRADKLIALQRENKPDSLDYILGLTLKVIPVTKKDASGQIKKPSFKYEDWGIM